MSIRTKRWVAWLITVGAMFLTWTGLVDLADHLNVKMAAGRVILGLAFIIRFQAEASKPNSN